jgi:hypothetical protein
VEIKTERPSRVSSSGKLSEWVQRISRTSRLGSDGVPIKDSPR